jgi:cellulose synthase/poly-beta-1,6-N-acetylglucosamine synthase-like glycosyltransferase
MVVLSLLISFFSFLYLAVSFWLSRGLKKIDSPRYSSDSKSDLKIDLLIAAHNEEKNLPILFKSLEKQSLNRSNFTITVIDDRSTDGTSQIVESWREKLPNLSLLKIRKTDPKFAPKKFALTEGIKFTTNEIIVVTDADCIVPPKWLELLLEEFENERVGLVQGITKYFDVKEISRPLFLFQSLDFLSHGVVAAAGIGQNLPINSNANNFAYRRKVFEELEGYGKLSTVVSGDDDLLLQRVWSSNRWDINFITSKDATVLTEPSYTIKELLEQRKRWGSKTVHYAPKQVLVLAIIFIFYITTALSIPLSLLNLLPLWIFPLLLFLKLFGELFFLIPGTQIFDSKSMRLHSIWSSPIQLFLVLYAVLGGVFGKFKWKDSSFSRRVNG